MVHPQNYVYIIIGTVRLCELNSRVHCYSFVVECSGIGANIGTLTRG